VDIYLTNTLTKKKEKFVPINNDFVGIYSCGPTVYWNQHIGHMFAYVHWDILVRFFKYLGYKTKWVMNITDVGHLVSDEDEGEDKMEKGAVRENKSVWEIADKYIEQFNDSLKLLNITPPDILCRATEHINEQIDLIKKIEERGFTYRTKTGLVFDTSKFPDYAKFANLNLQELKSGARVEVDKEKRQPWDFLLWVTNQPDHVMQWDSPWGRGFPGWHIECTAMSTKYLGEKFDIHTGGKEHIPVHHTNEIAQAYGAFGDKTANYWLHNEWLLIDGKKMSKSTGNFLTVEDLVKKGFSPLSLRYLILNSHYKTGLNFTLKSLKASEVALVKLKELANSFKNSKRSNLSSVDSTKINNFREEFISSLVDDINISKALAVTWQMVKSNIPSEDKYDLLSSFDEVFGLDLTKTEEVLIPDEIKLLSDKREKFKKSGKYEEADKIRKEILNKGYKLEDRKEGVVIKPVQNAKD
jgi:cysteinyl-tRNA synthetase